jgi:hypothetical protein
MIEGGTSALRLIHIGVHHSPMKNHGRQDEGKSLGM